MGSNTTVLGNTSITNARIYGLLDLPSGISAPNIINSINGITGIIGFSAGTGISITPSGNTLILSSTVVGGSGNVTLSGLCFTQVGSGAVARTIDSKLKDVFSVKDFGAVGDGITDDRAAIQTALGAMFGLTGISSGTIYFPYGTYKINAAVGFEPVNKDIKILGDNATIKHGGTVGAASLLTLNGNTHYIHLENIIFDGDSRTSRIFQSYSAAQSTARILINNCQFLNTFAPGPPDQSGSLGCYIEGGFKSVTLTNSLFKNILRAPGGLTGGGCQAFCVVNRGAEPTYAEWVNVTNNVFENVLTGTSGGDTSKNSDADGVVLFGGRTYGANTIPASSIVANNKFTNCQGRSIKIQGDEATITGNQIYCNVRSIASGSPHINPQIAVGNVSNNIFHFDVTSDGKSPFTEDGLPIAGGVGGIPTKSSTAIGFYTDLTMARPKYYTVRDNIIINNVPANIGIYRGGVFSVSENDGFTQSSGLNGKLATEPLFVTVDGNSIIGRGESQRLGLLFTRGKESDGATAFAPPSQTAVYATITNNYVAKISAPFTGGLTLTQIFGSPEATGGVLLSSTSQYISGTAYNKIFLSNNIHGSSYFVPVMDRQSQSSFQSYELDLVSVNNRKVNDPFHGITGELNTFGTIGVCASNLITANLTATKITVGSGGISGINLVNSVRGITGTVGLTGSPGMSITSTGNTVTFTNTGVISVSAPATGIALTGTSTAPIINNSGVITVGGRTGTVGLTGSTGMSITSTGNTFTFTNTGVVSVDGSTGAITNIAKLNVAQNFTEIQNFSKSLTINSSTSGPAVLGGLTADFTKNTIFRPTLQFYDEPISNLTVDVGNNILTLDLSIAQVFVVTLNTTIASIQILGSNSSVSNRTIGFTLILKSANPTATVTTWGSIRWPGGIAPTLSTGTNKTDIFSFVTVDNGVSYFGFIGGQNYPVPS